MDQVILEGSKISGTAGGISNYAINLFSELKAIEKDYNIESNLLLLHRVPEENVFFRKAAVNTSSLMIASYAGFARMLMGFTKIKYRLFHSPYMFLPPKRRDAINVLSVHDLINFEKSSTIRNRLRAVTLKWGIRRADHYVCSSNATRVKLRQYFPQIKDTAVSVIHLGTDPVFFTQAVLNPLSTERIKTLTSAPYLLYVGLRRDYKNFDSLLAYMAQSPANELKVICVGGGEFSDFEYNKIKAADLQNTVIHAGPTGIEELKYLYQNAKALAYTSLQEGFGIPIIEAMASGCPVMCGDFSSMKEIAGGHAILMNDFSKTAFEEALNLASARTPEDNERAKAYASHFTWKKTAGETLALYNRLLTDNTGLK